MNNKYVLLGSLAVSWVGTAANLAAEAKSILGALAALASLVASCYAIAIARKKFTEKGELNRGHRAFTENTERRTKRKGATARRRRAMISLLALILFSSSGCTHATKKLGRARVAFEKQESVLREESRALTTGVVDALEKAPKNPETELARSLAVADQEIEGLPLERLPVMEALSGDARAKALIDERVAEIQALRVENVRLAEQVRATEERLVAMGVKFEEERNRRVKFWSKWLSAGTLLIGGFVALFVFCPVALPIVGRLLGWAVGKIPALADAVGVVGKDAFDAVVKGVGNAREAMKKKESEELEAFDTSMRIETDAAHKRLIEARRVVVGV